MVATAKVSPGAARLAREEGRPRPVSPVRDIAMAVFAPENYGIGVLEQAKSLLQNVYEVDVVKDVIDKAEALRTYAKQAGLGLDSQNLAAEIKLRAERRAGELLREVERAPRAGAGRPQQIGVQPESQFVTEAPVATPYQRALTAASIKPSTARRWQNEASVPETVFEAHVADAKKRGHELTSTSVAKLAPKQAYEPKPIAVVDQALLGPNDRFHVGDIMDLPWPKGEVDLICTSPPYALDKPYLGGDVATYADWQAAMGDWLGVLYDLLNPQHGRLCLNVPLDRDLGGWQPVSADVMHMAQASGFKFRTWILWDKSQAGAGTDRGSLDSASAPNVTAPVESILVFYRGSWKRTGPAAIPHDEWLTLCGPRGIWQFNGVQGDDVAPAPFPEELPRRCIELFSFPADVVADPFVGRGTTAGIAARLDRHAWAADRNPACVAAAQAWVARERA